MRPDELPRIAHDPETFEAFYREHVEGVERFVARRVRDPHLAADLTAEVFLAAIDAAPGYRPDRGAPVAWLFGVARNVVSAEYRRAGREQRAQAQVEGRRLLDPDDVARMQDRIDAEARSRELYERSAALPEGERAVFELVALDDLSPAEAAGPRHPRGHRAGPDAPGPRDAPRPSLRRRRHTDRPTHGGMTMSDSHTFEDRLLDNLRRVVAQSPAPGVTTGHRRPRRTELALAGMAAAGRRGRDRRHDREHDAERLRAPVEAGRRRDRVDPEPARRVRAAEQPARGRHPGRRGLRARCEGGLLAPRLSARSRPRAPGPRRSRGCPFTRRARRATPARRSHGPPGRRRGSGRTAPSASGSPGR